MKKIEIIFGSLGLLAIILVLIFGKNLLMVANNMDNPNRDRDYSMPTTYVPPQISVWDDDAENLTVSDSRVLSVEIMPLGYFVDKQTQKKGWAYVKKEADNYVLYKFIDNQTVNTKVEIPDTCSEPVFYHGKISPDGQKLVYFMTKCEEMQYGVMARLYFGYLDLNQPVDFKMIASGPDGHFALGDNYFFSPDSSKLLYTVLGGDENGGGGSVLEYDLINQTEKVLFSYSNWYDLEKEVGGGEYYDLGVLGYATLGQETSAFYVVGQNNFFTIYKGNTAYQQGNKDIVLTSKPVNVQISPDGKYLVYFQDKNLAHLSMASLAASIEFKPDTVLSLQDIDDLNGAVKDFVFDSYEVLYVLENKNEQCLIKTLYNYNGIKNRMIYKAADCY